MRTLQIETFSRRSLTDLDNLVNKWLIDKDAFDIKSIDINPFTEPEDESHRGYQKLFTLYVATITYYLPLKGNT